MRRQAPQIVARRHPLGAARAELSPPPARTQTRTPAHAPAAHASGRARVSTRRVATRRTGEKPIRWYIGSARG